MRHSQSEKMETFRTVEDSRIGIKQTLIELGINRSTFYDCYCRYREGGFDALAAKPPHRRLFWNAIPPDVKKKMVETALEHLDKVLVSRPGILLIPRGITSLSREH